MFQVIFESTKATQMQIEEQGRELDDLRQQVKVMRSDMDRIQPGSASRGLKPIAVVLVLLAMVLVTLFR